MFARILLILLLFIFSTSHAFAKQISPQKRDLVDQILVINQTAKLIPLMTSALTGQIITAIAKGRNGIDDNLKLIIHSEVKKAIKEQFVLNNKLNDIFYELYNEYFSTSQMQDIVNFYNSPAGKQLMKHSEDVSQRSQEQAKAHAKIIGPIIQKRLLKILDNIDEDLKAPDATPK